MGFVLSDNTHKLFLNISLSNFNNCRVCVCVCLGRFCVCPTQNFLLCLYFPHSNCYSLGRPLFRVCVCVSLLFWILLVGKFFDKKRVSTTDINKLGWSKFRPLYGGGGTISHTSVSLVTLPTIDDDRVWGHFSKLFFGRLLQHTFFETLFLR